MIVFGHLGNFLEAFAAVRRLGADGVELDLRRGPDGALLVHHDPVLSGDAPPPLADVLDACIGLVVNIEIKNLKIDPDFDPSESLSRGLVELLRRRGLRDNVVVSSFAMAALDAVREQAPDLPTMFLTLPDWDQWRALDRAGRHGHRGIHPHAHGVTGALVDAAHRAGLTVTAWAADDVPTVAAMAAARVDGVIADTPKAILAARRC